MDTVLKETINLPKKSVVQLGKVFKVFESAQNDIDDFLIFQNKKITNETKKARKEHTNGKAKSFSCILKKYV